MKAGPGQAAWEEDHPRRRRRIKRVRRRLSRYLIAGVIVLGGFSAWVLALLFLR